MKASVFPKTCPAFDKTAVCENLKGKRAECDVEQAMGEHAYT